MKGLLVLHIAGVICSLSAGSYVYSKANKCRNECKRDEHCMYEGYVCEPAVCQGKKINKCVRASVISKPKVMVPLTTGVIHGSVDPRDGIIPSEIINVKTGGGRLVDRGIPPLGVETGFKNVGILPVISSDVINVKHDSPQVLAIGPATGFNDADRMFMCVDNCVESNRCLGDKDCVKGCKKLCENEKSLINIRPGIVKTGGGHLVNTGIRPLDVDTGFQNVGILPISSDVINVKHGSPQVLPISPATGFNDADKMFMCVDNCAETNRCLGDRDCVIGCKKLCENEKSLINIRPGIVKTGGGHLVNTGIRPLDVDTGFQNVGILPVISSDVINVKHGSPQVLPIGPATGFNDADRMFMCVDNCAESNRCLGDKDCVKGCKKLCENEKSLINIRPGIVKTGGGHLVNTGIRPLDVDTGFQNVGILPVISSDVINVKHGSPKVLPIGPAAGFNDADRMFMCVDNCAESNRCLGDKDCVLGCKKLCENEKSLINIRPGINTGLTNNLPLADRLNSNGRINAHLSNDFLDSKVQNSDINIGFPIDPVVRINTGGGFPIGADSAFPVKPIDKLTNYDLSGHKGISSDVLVDMGTPSFVDPINQITQTGVIGTKFFTGQFHQNPADQPFSVTPIDIYPTNDMLGKKDFMNDQHMNTKSDLPSDVVGQIPRIKPIGIGFPSELRPLNQGNSFIPVDPSLEADQLSIFKSALPADSVGHITRIGQNGARFNPLFPVNSVKSYFPHGKSGHNQVSNGGNIGFRPLLPLDTTGQVGHIGSVIPVIDTRVGSNIDQHVLVDSNGQVQPIDSNFGTGKVVPLPVPTKPLTPVSPIINKQRLY